MAIDVSTEVLIRLPREQVATFMFDPAKDKLWTQGVVECRPLTDGPLRNDAPSFSMLVRHRRLLDHVAPLRRVDLQCRVVEAAPSAPVHER